MTSCGSYKRLVFVDITIQWLVQRRINCLRLYEIYCLRINCYNKSHITKVLIVTTLERCYASLFISSSYMRLHVAHAIKIVARKTQHLYGKSCDGDGTTYHLASSCPCPCLAWTTLWLLRYAWIVWGFVVSTNWN